MENNIDRLKRALANDFFMFSALVFKDYIKSPFEDFHKEWHIMKEGEKDRIGIIAPRGHTKTTTNMIEEAHKILESDHHFFVVIGNSVQKAIDSYILPLMQEFETNEIIRGIWGDVRGKTWGAKGLEFYIRDENGNIIDRKKIVPFGVGQSIRGIKYNQYRPDYIVVDDIEDDEQVNNPSRRAYITRWFYEQVYPALEKVGDMEEGEFACKPRMIVSGTILHPDSFLRNLLEMTDSWEVKKYSCVYVDENGIRQSLWKGRYSVEYWDKLREQYKKEGRESSFMQEYMNEVVAEDDREIDVKKVQYISLKMAKEMALERYIAVDIAISSKENLNKSKSDFNAMVCIGVDRQLGNIYVLDALRFKTNDLNDTVENAYKLARKWLPKKIIYEKMGFQSMFEGIIKNIARREGMSFNVYGITPGNKRKEERIKMTVKYFVETERMFLVEGNDNIKEIYNEMYDFPLNKHDDLIDALAYAISGANTTFRFGGRKNAVKKELGEDELEDLEEAEKAKSVGKYAYNYYSY